MKACEWSARTADGSRSSVLYGRAEFLAISENDLAKIYVGGAAFDAMADESDLVSCLNGCFTPALTGQCIRTIRFANPFFYFAILVRDVEVDERVGIDPLEFRDDAFQGDGVHHIVIRPAVVREYRPRNQEKTSDPDEYSQ